jgi:hypothetical protein
MKKLKIYILFGYIFLFASANFAQDFISTDPNDPYNPYRENVENNFDWTASEWLVYLPQHGWGQNNQPIRKSNPYQTTTQNFSHINFYGHPNPDPDTLDFYPEDGWELVHKHNGYALDETEFLPTHMQGKGPHYLLYNKYTGILRTFKGAFVEFQFDVGYTSLSFFPSTYAREDLHFNALFGQNVEIVNTLDMRTNVYTLSHGSMVNPVGGFFFGEYKMNYDPCACNKHSLLRFSFSTVNELDLHIEGRLIGTITELGTNSPLHNGRGFLTSVNDENFSVNGGMLTYYNIDALVEKYKAEDVPRYIQLGYDALKGVLKFGAGPLDEVIDGMVSNIATDLLGGEEILGVTLADTIKASMGLVGAQTSKLSAMLEPTKNRPGISFIEAEMVLTGTATDHNILYSHNFKLGTPGSLTNNNPEVLDDLFYPAYNEALGTFALLKKPSVAWFEEVWEYASNYICYYDYWDLPANRHFKRFKFNKDSFKFLINPATLPNYDKTKILGALVFKVNSGDLMNFSCEEGANQEASGPGNYITDFYPIESLHRNITSFSFDRCYGVDTPDLEVEVFLRLQIFYRFDEDRYGNEHSHWDIITYPVSLEGGGFVYENEPEIPDTVNIGNLSVYEDQVIKALSIINITGEISLYNNATLTLEAGKSVTRNDASVLDPNINIIIRKFNNAWEDAKIPPVSETYLNNFCENEYKADTLTDEALASFLYSHKSLNSNKSKSSSSSNHTLKVYPNPTGGTLNIEYVLDQDDRIGLSIVDLSGRHLLTIQNNISMPRGYHTKQINVTNLDNGLYMLIFDSSKGRHLEKLIVQH